MFPIRNEEFRRWILGAIGEAPDDDDVLSIYGSDPYTESELMDFITDGNMDLYKVHNETDTLIVGREGWNEEDLDELLDEREGQYLKVYSQEMYLARWITGKDPFDDPNIAALFVGGHPALEYISSRWIDWVSTAVTLKLGTGNLDIASPKTRVLKELGYAVGKTNGKLPCERQQILRTAFTSELTKVLSKKYLHYCQKSFPDYMEEWGKPQSERRLIKMRDYLATLCKRQKKLRHAEAAADYQEDLDWLEVNIYTGRFKFDWLNSQID